MLRHINIKVLLSLIKIQVQILSNTNSFVSDKFMRNSGIPRSSPTFKFQSLSDDSNICQSIFLIKGASRWRLKQKD